MKKIIHIITGLNTGGAENMLYKVLRYSSPGETYHEVISLLDEGVYGEKIKEIGIKVHCLNLSFKNIIPSVLIVKNIAKSFDIVDTWLYHADLLGYLISKLFLHKKLIWNMRQSNLSKEANKLSNVAIMKLNAKFSKNVDLITYNSNKALDNHTKIGYKGRKSIVIPNGFDLDLFKFSVEERVEVREKLKIKENDKVIITVGRWDIQKDYHTLIEALFELKKNNIRFKMLMVGTSLDNSNHELTELINSYNLKKDVILIGRQDNHKIPSFLSAADVYVSSSVGESFSNSLAEAMACELTCVVTDVGDSKLIVDDTGITVGTKDPIAMSKAIIKCFKNEKQERNLKARERVMNNFDIKKVSDLFNKRYDLV